MIQVTQCVIQFYAPLGYFGTHSTFLPSTWSAYTLKVLNVLTLKQKILHRLEVKNKKAVCARWIVERKQLLGVCSDNLFGHVHSLTINFILSAAYTCASL